MSLTPEARAKAQAGRKAALAASAHFKRDWLDSDLWDSLAKAKGIRLPVWSKRPTAVNLKRWHKRLDVELFETVYGCGPGRLIDLNPHTPLRAFVGMMLERAKQ